MLNYIMSHPWLLALIVPPALAAVPSLIVKAEKAALARLFAQGDAIDQKFMRSVVRAAVLWAEEKGDLAGGGAKKFDAAEKILNRALPFLSAQQCEDLIEKAVLEMDAEAKKSLDAPPTA